MKKHKHTKGIGKGFLEKMTMTMLMVMVMAVNSFGITGAEFKEMKYSIFAPGMLENTTSVPAKDFNGTVYNINEDIDKDGSPDVGYRTPWRKNESDREKYFSDVTVSTPYSTMDSISSSVRFSQMFTVKLGEIDNFTFLVDASKNDLLYIVDGKLKTTIAKSDGKEYSRDVYIQNEEGGYEPYPVEELIQYHGVGTNPWVQIEVHISGAYRDDEFSLEYVACYERVSYKINGKQIYIKDDNSYYQDWSFCYNDFSDSGSDLHDFKSGFRIYNAAVAEVISLEGQNEATASSFFDRFRLTFIEAVDENPKYYIKNIYYIPPGDNSSVTIASQSVSSTSMSIAISGGVSVSAGVGLEYTPTVWSGFCGISAEASVTAAAEYNKEKTQTTQTTITEVKKFVNDGEGDQVEYQTLHLTSIFYGRLFLEEAFSDEIRSVDNWFVGSFIYAKLDEQIKYAGVEDFRNFANKDAVNNLNALYLKDENGMVQSNHVGLKNIIPATVTVDKSEYTYSVEKSEEISNSQSFSLDLATSATAKIIAGGVTVSGGVTAHIGGSLSMTDGISEGSGISYTYQDETAWDNIVAKYWELPNGIRVHQLDSDDYTSAPVEPFTTPSVGFDYYVIEGEGDLTIPGEVVSCKLVIKTTSLSNAAKGAAYITDILPTDSAQQYYDIAITSRKRVPAVGSIETISFTCTLKDNVSNPNREKVAVVVHYGTASGGIYSNVDYWEKDDCRKQNPISLLAPSSIMMGKEAELSATLQYNSGQSITFVSSDSNVVKIVANKLIPVSTGSVTITATTEAKDFYFGDTTETIVIVEGETAIGTSKNKVFANEGYSLTVAPTPTKDSGKVLVVSEESGEVIFTIFTTSERKIAKISKEIEANDKLEFDWEVISKLQPDVYFIEMKINGDVKAVESIVKIKK